MGHLISVDTALKLTRDFKKEKKNVVFTHGAFDLFHAGHSLFLNKSKNAGDILIVGLDPDENVRKYKGGLRPIIKQKHRAEMLTNHTAVDYLFIIRRLNNLVDEYFLNFYEKMKPTQVTVGKNFSFQDRKDKKLKNSKIKEIEAEVTATTKIITSILNGYQIAQSYEQI